MRKEYFSSIGAAISYFIDNLVGMVPRKLCGTGSRKVSYPELCGSKEGDLESNKLTEGVR